MIIAMLVAIGIPLVFLGIVRWLDLYALGSIKGILICMGGGLVAFFLALQINTYIGGLHRFHPAGDGGGAHPGRSPEVAGAHLRGAPS